MSKNDPRVWTRSSAPSPERLAYETAFVTLVIEMFERKLETITTIAQRLSIRNELAAIRDRIVEGVMDWLAEDRKVRN
jgi:hypothetical protein